MKKISILTLFAGAVAFISLYAAPLPAAALTLDPDKFTGKYSGTWTYTRDTCNPDAYATGTIVIKILELQTDGTVTSATVKYSDGDLRQATGHIFKKDGVRFILLQYDYDTNNHQIIMARLTKKNKIRGMYDETDASCNWGGTVTLSKN